MANNYSKGRNAEQKVAQVLRNAGAKVKLSPGSKGAEDMIADFGSKTWYVQVKSGDSAPNQLSGVDKQRLNAKATKNDATPVLATVKDNKITFTSTRSGRNLTP